ncbi:glutathione S-transferase family protein [Sphingomonas sp. LaA6.9]|nr:glutathione S-transferase family protein [Sphingomonas sp. LaA6.9]MCJ8157175.1 glutathione S-transferase family protein [Sphingomonas sp. LaA6.9]
MKLYGSSMSPYVRKVLAYAAEKGLPLELEMAGMGRGGPEFEAASPFRKMPAFSDGDFRICDSTAIITYLEAKYPEPSLIPAEPRSRARTIWFEEFADTILMGCGAKMFFNRFVAPKVLGREGDLAVADAAERDELPPILDYLEKTIPDSGYLVDDRLTLADISVASPVANLDHIGVAIDKSRWPRTAAYVEAILARPSFAVWLTKERAFVQAA